MIQDKILQAINLIKIANNDLPALELKYNRLRKEIDYLELEKQKSRELGNVIKVLAKTSEDYNRQIKILHRRKVGLDSLVREFENKNEGYKKIGQITEEEVNNTLSNSNYHDNTTLYNSIKVHLIQHS
jgi:hypothetical protein